MPESTNVIEDAVAVDAHVHIHDDFELSVFLDAAARNFAQACREMGVRRFSRSVLMLTETSSASYFDQMYEASRGAGSDLDFGRWRPAATKEECSILVERGEDVELVVVAGRQVVTREKLEVLVLGTRERIADGTPIDVVIDRCKELNATAVVPWGFGKWLGRRGRIVRDLIARPDGRVFHLGDNSGRLRYAPLPREFALARSRGCRILPGSDPLPFRREQQRAGQYGFLIEAPVSAEYPADDVRRHIEDANLLLRPYGQSEQLFRFLRNQIQMQFETRIRNRSACDSEAAA